MCWPDPRWNEVKEEIVQSHIFLVENIKCSMLPNCNCSEFALLYIILLRKHIIFESHFNTKFLEYKPIQSDGRIQSGKPLFKHIHKPKYKFRTKIHTVSLSCCYANPHHSYWIISEQIIYISPFGILVLDVIFGLYFMCLSICFSHAHFLIKCMAPLISLVSSVDGSSAKFWLN